MVGETGIDDIACITCHCCHMEIRGNIPIHGRNIYTCIHSFFSI